MSDVLAFESQAEFDRMASAVRYVERLRGTTGGEAGYTPPSPNMSVYVTVTGPADEVDGLFPAVFMYRNEESEDDSWYEGEECRAESLNGEDLFTDRRHEGRVNRMEDGWAVVSVGVPVEGSVPPFPLFGRSTVVGVGNGLPGNTSDTSATQVMMVKGNTAVAGKWDDAGLLTTIASSGDSHRPIPLVGPLNGTNNLAVVVKDPDALGGNSRGLGYLAMPVAPENPFQARATGVNHGNATRIKTSDGCATNYTVPLTFPFSPGVLGPSTATWWTDHDTIFVWKGLTADADGMPSFGTEWYAMPAMPCGVASSSGVGWAGWLTSGAQYIPGEKSFWERATFLGNITVSNSPYSINIHGRGIGNTSFTDDGRTVTIYSANDNYINLHTGGTGPYFGMRGSGNSSIELSILSGTPVLRAYNAAGTLTFQFPGSYATTAALAAAVDDLEDAIEQAENDAEDYADAAAAAAEANANAYADTAAAAALDSATDYADTAAAAALDAATDHADAAAANATAAANSFTTAAIGTATGALQTYADNAANTAGNTAQANAADYTNSVAGNLTSDLQSYANSTADAAADAALDLANAYTDAGLGTLTIDLTDLINTKAANSTAYTDTSIATLANSTASNIANSAANTYACATNYTNAAIANIPGFNGAVTGGGTGRACIPKGSVPIGNNTGPVNFASTGATGWVLTSTGPGNDVSFQLAPYWWGVCDFRLSLGNTSVPSADQIGSTNLYLRPHAGTQISIKETTGNWMLRSASSATLALSNMTSGKNYDVFAYWTGSAVALELGAAWTNDSTRAAPLVETDGILTKPSDVSRRFLGTIRATGTTTTEDSAAKRFVSNAHNRVFRTLYRIDLTSHTYGTATNREWLNGVGGPFKTEWISCYDDAVWMKVFTTFSAATAASVAPGLGIDWSAGGGGALLQTLFVANAAAQRPYISDLQRLPAGYHWLVATEYASATTTFSNFEISGFILG